MAKALLVIAIVIVVVLSATLVWAGIRSEIEAQEQQINRGINSGRLTQPEADILMENLNHIKSKLERMRSDRRLTDRERYRLERMLERNSRMIRRLKHNDVGRIY